MEERWSSAGTGVPAAWGVGESGSPEAWSFALQVPLNPGGGWPAWDPELHWDFGKQAGGRPGAEAPAPCQCGR